MEPMSTITVHELAQRFLSPEIIETFGQVEEPILEVEARGVRIEWLLKGKKWRFKGKVSVESLSAQYAIISLLSMIMGIVTAGIVNWFN